MICRVARAAARCPWMSRAGEGYIVTADTLAPTHFRFRMCLNFSTTSGREETRSTSKLWTERAEQADRPPLRTSVREHQTGIESKQI